MAGVPGSGRALVVEDDPQIARLLREILAAEGYEVAEVDDGALAASAVRALEPDVVLLDVGLPNVHGFDVLDELKHDPRTAAVPVAVVTAWWQPGVESRARAMGAAAVLPKPFELADVTAAVAGARLAAPAAAAPAAAVNH